MTTDDAPGVPAGPNAPDMPEAPAVVVQRVLPAPPDVVFDEWIDPEAMAEWMCPRPSRPTRIDIDPRVGGRFFIDIDDEGFELTVTGEYLELERPHRLRFTWDCSVWEPSDPESIVTVTLEPHGDRCTLMTIHHVQLPPKVVDSHRHGWTLIGQQLEDALKSLP
jgi:uncharacterized protein YndB with AHSA1/START domain